MYWDRFIPWSHGKSYGFRLKRMSIFFLLSRKSDMWFLTWWKAPWSLHWENNRRKFKIPSLWLKSTWSVLYWLSRTPLINVRTLSLCPVSITKAKKGENLKHFSSNHLLETWVVITEKNRCKACSFSEKQHLKPVHSLLGGLWANLSSSLKQETW